MPFTFESLALSPPLLAVVGELGYTHPTPIQAAGIPVLLVGPLAGTSRLAAS